MGRVELRHIPASRLPKDLRGDFLPSDLVDVVVNAASGPKPLSREELIAVLNRPRDPSELTTSEEAVARIRALRDEWDD